MFFIKSIAKLVVHIFTFCTVESILMKIKSKIKLNGIGTVQIWIFLSKYFPLTTNSVANIAKRTGKPCTTKHAIPDDTDSLLLLLLLFTLNQFYHPLIYAEVRSPK